MAIGVGTLGDYTPSYGNGLSPTPTFAQTAAASVVGVARTTGKAPAAIASGFGPAIAIPIPVKPSSANGGCGEEPARKQVGMVAVDVDPAYSKTWHACMAAKGVRELAAAKAAVDAAADCGAEPAFTANAEGRHFYADPELGPYWAACRANKAKASPPIVPGQPVIVPAGLATGTPPPTPGRGSSSAAIEQMTAPPAAVAFVSPLATPPPPEAPAVVGATFGGHVEAPDAAWIAGGVAVLLGLGWLLHKKGVF